MRNNKNILKYFQKKKQNHVRMKQAVIEMKGLQSFRMESKAGSIET